MSQLPLPSHPALQLANRNDDDLFEHLEDWLSRLQKLINSNLFPGGAGIPLDLPSGPKARAAEKELNQSAEVEEALQRRDEQVKEHLEDWLSRVQIFFLDKDKRAGAIAEVLPRSPSKSLSNKKPPVANSFQGQLAFGQTLSHTVSLEGLDEEEETLEDGQGGWWSNLVKMMPSSRPIEPESTLAWQRHLQRFVGSTRFESLSATVIITNSIFTAIQVQWAAADPFTPPDDILFIIGSIYTFVFTIELIMRLLAGGLAVFCKEDWGWIALDMVVVASSVFEFALEITIRLEAEESSETNVSTSMRLVRVLRVAKITRAIRIVRLVKFVRSLRTLLYCIGRTLRAMLWSGILLLLIIFLFALIFTDITTEYLADPVRDDLVANYIKVRFGALDSSMHTLFACTTGGLTWIETRDSLAGINELWGFLFEGYIAFCMFAVLNVMTGVFCQSAIESAERDHEMILSNIAQEKAKYFRAVRRLFQHLDANSDGGVTIKEFQDAWKDPSLISIFDALEINAADAWALFAQLDRDGDHEVDVNEFLEGCMILKGPARSIDVICIKKDILSLQESFHQQAADLAAIRERMCLK